MVGVHQQPDQSNYLKVKLKLVLLSSTILPVPSVRVAEYTT